MTFRELILELFDKPFRFKQTNSGYENRFVFYDDMGELYEVFIIKEDEESVSVDFTKNGSFDVEESQNPFRVFATVYEILTLFLNDKIKTVEFFAKSAEPSRVKVYKTFANKLKTKHKFKTLNTQTTKIATTFTLRR